MTDRQSRVRLKAQGMWATMSKSERKGVGFGLFPHGKMKAAMAEGHDSKVLAAALMKVASDEQAKELSS